MTRNSLVGIAALLSTLSFAAALPMAQARAGEDVPLCSFGVDQHWMGKRIALLATRLQLSTLSDASVEAWNGCIKVMATFYGEPTVAFYDPDSFALIRTMGGPARVNQ